MIRSFFKAKKLLRFILRGATFFEYMPSLGILFLMAVLLFCVCALRFRKKIG